MRKARLLVSVRFVKALLFLTAIVLPDLFLFLLTAQHCKLLLKFADLCRSVFVLGARTLPVLLSLLRFCLPDGSRRRTYGGR